MRTSRNEKRKHRKIRIKKKISGTELRPRLVVYRSNKYIYAQLVDDIQGRTLAASSSRTIAEAAGSNIRSAHLVGKDIAQKAQENDIQQVVYDRNGYYFHGRIKAVADGAREGGLKI